MPDDQRPLNARGRDAAPRMGRYMADAKLQPGRILCSSSTRTRETAALAFAGLADFPQPKYVDSLYLATAAHLLATIQKGPAGITHQMLIGHNPGLHDLALELIGSGPSDARRRLVAKLPTAALVVITFDTTMWKHVAVSTGRLERFVTPRDLQTVQD